ncbi:MAG: dolichyl-phosphate beta-glucosyltransferase [Cellvibrionaceae bacterium]|jgi:dolichyl-phosphate beta-glucosyltransferase
MSNAKVPPLLTIVVPAYNEGKRLPATLPQITHYVENQDFDVEVIVVNNNSSDDTRNIAEHFAADYDYIKVIDEKRQGKGAAVKTGMMAGLGDYLFIADADLSMPIGEVSHFLPPVSGDYDVAIGSREAPGAVRYHEPEYRHIMGRVFNLIVRLFAVPGFHDTQAGFKCFKREAAHLVIPKQTVDGWAFDVELLYIALHHKCKIIEIPIEWHYQPNSRINPLQDSYEMFLEVFKIRRKGKQGIYD